VIQLAIESGEVSLPPGAELSETGKQSENGGEKASENGRHEKNEQQLHARRAPTVKRLMISPEDVSCDVCGRVLLKGEPTILFTAPQEERRRNPGEKERKWVCEVCAPLAEDAGWKARRAPGRRQLGGGTFGAGSR
jgi:hypothetical protein